MTDPIKADAAPPAGPVVQASTANLAPADTGETWLDRRIHDVQEAGQAIGGAAVAAGHGIAHGLQSAGTALHDVLPAVESEAEKIATVEWPIAAQFVERYVARNKAEFGAKAAAAVVSAIVAQVPGAAAFAPAISEAVTTELEAMIGVLLSEMERAGKAVGPGTGAPV